ncbi:MAG: GerMN domain-containing protein [Spirochaetaceae bacterium]|jgi:spore germination protein GerM|nr:GerMN domain-containing protein [Spirochaetaceae bacterium]
MKSNPYKTIYKEPLSKEAKVKILRITLFWVVFALFVICLFIINAPRIRATMRSALWPAWFRSRSASQVPVPPLADGMDGTDGMFDGNLSGAAFADTDDDDRRAYETPRPEAEHADRNAPVVSVAPEDARVAGSAPAQTAQPAPDPVAQSAAPVQIASGIQPPRERSLYFIQLDRGGALLRARVTRAVPSSNAPLLDVLEALLRGPTEEERRQGILSLIPQGTAILSASVLRDTAYINISEGFQYNTFGVEGYAAQLVQIVWTATEFANIKDVQILIEGRRIDYLGEGIWIGSPITRDPLKGF